MYVNFHRGSKDLQDKTISMIKYFENETFWRKQDIKLISLDLTFLDRENYGTTSSARSATLEDTS